MLHKLMYMFYSKSYNHHNSDLYIDNQLAASHQPYSPSVSAVDISTHLSSPSPVLDAVSETAPTTVSSRREVCEGGGEVNSTTNHQPMVF